MAVGQFWKAHFPTTTHHTKSPNQRGRKPENEHDMANARIPGRIFTLKKKVVDAHGRKGYGRGVG